MATEREITSCKRPLLTLTNVNSILIKQKNSATSL